MQDYEERRRRPREESDKFAREMRLYQREEEKMMSGGTKNFSIFHLDGWRYWGNYGWSDLCHDEPGNRRPPRFETDCYIDPSNSEKVYLYRDLNFNWVKLLGLIINIFLLLGFLWMVMYLFRHEMKRPGPSLSILRK